MSARVNELNPAVEASAMEGLSFWRETGQRLWASRIARACLAVLAIFSSWRSPRNWPTTGMRGAM